MKANKQEKKQMSVGEIVLSAIALAIVTAIFCKAIIDIDVNYDAGWYHLPFAARIWGIVPETAFRSQDLIEYRYQGFPLLAHFFQGLLWKLTGRIQTTNLVGYFSLLAYFFFLRSYFQIPLYLSAIAILTIPAVLTHAATSFVDLPGNIGVSVVMMLTYTFFQQSRLPKKSELLLTFLGAAAAVNIKPQLQPLVFLLYWIVGARLLWLYFKYTNPEQRKPWRTVILGLAASIVIFATPIKNVALYGNPFYPIKIEVAGIVLNHQLTPQTYSEDSRPAKWLQSIFEINTPKWSADQWNLNDKRYLDRAGGFFGAYVVFNLLLLLGLTLQEQLTRRQPKQYDQQRSPRQKNYGATTALVLMLLVSLVPANFPQSHELRYFMFWMITLVSLNLYLLTYLQQQMSWSWLQPKYFSLVYLIFLAVVFTKTNYRFIQPKFAVKPYQGKAMKQELLKQMIPNQRVCMISHNPGAYPGAVPLAQVHTAFYYSSYFHPEIPYDYSLKTVTDPKSCRELPIIPPNYQDYF